MQKVNLTEIDIKMSPYKYIIKKIWILFTTFIIWIGANKSQMKNINTRIFYGGAISGNKGGPRVKLLRLQNQFPQKYTNFNVFYALSNYPNLNFTGLNILRTRNIPIVLNQNGAYWQGWYGDGWEKKNSMNAFLYQNCDFVFWQSSFAKEVSRKYLSTTDPNGEILFNAIDLDFFHPARALRNRKTFNFLVAGNFNWKSVYQIQGALEAYQTLPFNPYVKLRIAGVNDSIKKYIDLQITRLKINNVIETTGSFTQYEISKLLQDTDVYLALKYMDTCPNLVIESLGSGVPVIYSSSGGTKELVNQTCGKGLEVDEDWLSKPKTPDTHCLAQAMVQSFDWSNDMRESARSRAEELFDVRKWYARHKIVFEDLLSKRFQ